MQPRSNGSVVFTQQQQLSVHVYCHCSANTTKIKKLSSALEVKLSLYSLVLIQNCSDDLTR